MTHIENSLTDRSDMPVISTEIPFLIGVFFSFRLFVKLLAVRFLGTDPLTGTEITLALNYLLLIAVVLQSLAADGRPLGSFLKLTSIRWVVFILCFSFASLSWSVAASLPSALAYWGAMAADVAIVTLLLQTDGSNETAYTFMKGYVWGACALSIIAWLLPGQSDLRLGDEEITGANEIGYLCAFAFFFAQYLLQQKKGKFGPGAIILGVTLLRSLSKTTIVAFLLAEGFLLLRDKSMSRKTKLSLVAATMAITFLFSGLLLSYFDLYSNTGNSPETLTGRLSIWAVFLEEASKQPWIGHGFYSVANVIPPFGEFEARHAHNEFLQQFYLFGAMGIVMTVGLYGSFFLLARRAADATQRTFFYALLIFILVRGLAESEMYDFSFPLWAIVLFSMFLQLRKQSAPDAIIPSPTRSPLPAT